MRDRHRFSVSFCVRTSLVFPNHPPMYPTDCYILHLPLLSCTFCFFDSSLLCFSLLCFRRVYSCAFKISCYLSCFSHTLLPNILSRFCPRNLDKSERRGGRRKPSSTKLNRGFLFPFLNHHPSSPSTSETRRKSTWSCEYHFRLSCRRKSLSSRKEGNGHQRMRELTSILLPSHLLLFDPLRRYFSLPSLSLYLLPAHTHRYPALHSVPKLYRQQRSDELEMRASESSRTPAHPLLERRSSEEQNLLEGSRGMDRELLEDGRAKLEKKPWWKRPSPIW